MKHVSCNGIKKRAQLFENGGLHFARSIDPCQPGHTEMNRNLSLFVHVRSISRLKMLCEKEKLLITAVFSTRFENFLPLSSNLKLPCANSFIFEQSKIYRLGKG